MTLNQKQSSTPLKKQLKRLNSVIELYNYVVHHKLPYEHQISSDYQLRGAPPQPRADNIIHIRPSYDRQTYPNIVYDSSSLRMNSIRKSLWKILYPQLGLLRNKWKKVLEDNRNVQNPDEINYLQLINEREQDWNPYYYIDELHARAPLPNALDGLSESLELEFRFQALNRQLANNKSAALQAHLLYHKLIQKYYLELAEDTFPKPTALDMKFFIETYQDGLSELDFLKKKLSDLQSREMEIDEQTDHIRDAAEDNSFELDQLTMQIEKFEEKHNRENNGELDMLKDKRIELSNYITEQNYLYRELVGELEEIKLEIVNNERKIEKLEKKYNPDVFAELSLLIREDLSQLDQVETINDSFNPIVEALEVIFKKINSNGIQPENNEKLEELVKLAEEMINMIVSINFMPFELDDQTVVRANEIIDDLSQSIQDLQINPIQKHPWRKHPQQQYSEQKSERRQRYYDHILS